MYTNHQTYRTRRKTTAKQWATLAAAVCVWALLAGLWYAAQVTP